MHILSTQAGAILQVPIKSHFIRTVSSYKQAIFLDEHIRISIKYFSLGCHLIHDKLTLINMAPDRMIQYLLDSLLFLTLC